MSQSRGEKELILGNKQLISLFFVVVALCGVFFAMGYMVRGNSLKGSLSTTDDSGPAQTSATVKRQQPEPPRETGEASAAPDTTPAQTHPAADAPAAAAAVPYTDPAADPKPAPKESAQKADPIPAVQEPGATYVQVGALARADADATVRTLREQHLPATLAASSKEGLFRVLVGPYRETADVADAKSRLKTLGFSNTIVTKQ
jgi:cell division protein FtsN